VRTGSSGVAAFNRVGDVFRLDVTGLFGTVRPIVTSAGVSGMKTNPPKEAIRDERNRGRNARFVRESQGVTQRHACD
jgi:hypothetical protein